MRTQIQLDISRLKGTKNKAFIVGWWQDGIMAELVVQRKQKKLLNPKNLKTPWS